MESQSSQLNSGSPERSVTRVPRELPRVLIDGRKLGDGGIGVYIENLVGGLLESEGAQITVLCGRERAELASFKKQVRWVIDDATPYSLDEMVRMPRRIDWSKYDLFHAPHYTLPFGIPIPKIVTVHDLIHVTHPSSIFHPYVASYLIRSAVKRAERVIAVSRDTRNALLSFSGAEEEKVVFVPNAFSGDGRTVSSGSGSVPRKCQDLKPYVLAVLSNLKPHKGVRDLLVAFERVKRGMLTGASKGLSLVLAGYGTEEILSSPEVSKIVDASRDIRIVGRVPQHELWDLYRYAEALVVPSLAEGFCIPALEAQALGTRVICRPVPSLLELTTPADVVAEDFSLDAFVVAIRDSLNLPAVSVDRAAVVESRLREFSRERVANQTSLVYQSALAGVNG